MKHIAIITGASGGLGKEFVKIINGKAGIDEIWALARNKAKLEMLKAEVGDKVRVLPIDLTDTEDIKKLKDILNAESVSIKYLVNNAGMAKFCSYHDLSIDESMQIIHLNVNSVVVMGLLCIPYMEKGGHIINIASQAAFQPVPYQNLYSSTKAFVRNYTRALNVELTEKEVTATAVCPGFIQTDLLQKANIGAKRATNRFAGLTTPDKVAKKAVHDADKGKDMSVYGIYIKLAHVLAKILPQRLIMYFWLKQQRIK